MPGARSLFESLFSSERGAYRGAAPLNLVWRWNGKAQLIRICSRYGLWKSHYFFAQSIGMEAIMELYLTNIHARWIPEQASAIQMAPETPICFLLILQNASKASLGISADPVKSARRFLHMFKDFWTMLGSISARYLFLLGNPSHARKHKGVSEPC